MTENMIRNLISSLMSTKSFIIDMILTKYLFVLSPLAFTHIYCLPLQVHMLVMSVSITARADKEVFNTVVWNLVAKYCNLLLPHFQANTHVVKHHLIYVITLYGLRIKSAYK